MDQARSEATQVEDGVQQEPLDLPTAENLRLAECKTLINM